jgi:hypothetical protein
MSAIKTRTLARLAVPLAALAVLGGMHLQQLAYGTSEQAEPYHRTVAEAINNIPMTIGDWQGQDVPVPPAALKLLKPNALCSRQYRNVKTGRTVSLLVVHCRDAGEMAGHYPPICYPSNGWTQRSSEELEEVGQLPAGALCQYEFAMSLPTQSRMMTVMNVLLLPDGSLRWDMDAVREAAADYRTHFYGAGQVQLVFAENVSDAEKQLIFEEFWEALGPVVDAIGSGGMK